jgi:hypothetical protein
MKSGTQLNAGLLEDARNAKQAVVVAVAILTLPAGERRIAYSLLEYGDGEGIRFVRDFVAEVHKTKLLKPGERLDSQVWEMRRVRDVEDPILTDATMEP